MTFSLFVLKTYTVWCMCVCERKTGEVLDFTLTKRGAVKAVINESWPTARLIFSLTKYKQKMQKIYFRQLFEQINVECICSMSVDSNWQCKVLIGIIHQLSENRRFSWTHAERWRQRNWTKSRSKRNLRRLTAVRRAWMQYPYGSCIIERIIGK